MSLVTSQPTSVAHVVKGHALVEPTRIYGSGESAFATPELDLDQLVWSRSEGFPAADVPVREIIDLLVATSDRLRDDSDGLLAATVNELARTSPYERRILENAYEDLWRGFDGDRLWALLRNELGGEDVVDGWRPMTGAWGRTGAVRAYPTRIIHVLAGNAPNIAVMSVARGALMKGVHLLKMPSNDLFSAAAVLRYMAAVAPDHPVVRSFSAVYWRGGDSAVESVLCRPQFFDKIVAWGGDSAIRSAAQYIGPGFELVAFDPKNSVSMLGRETFSADATLTEIAELSGADSSIFNQEACASSRFHFVEGTTEQVDEYCAALLSALQAERRFTSAVVDGFPGEVREQVGMLRQLAPDYRVFGATDGTGLVVRSSRPVDFFPSHKTVNVVQVEDLTQAIGYINVATQTVSVYPPSRKAELRDRLAAAGVQRVVDLGGSAMMIGGFPHDGFFPLNRFVRWVNDENI